MGFIPIIIALLGLIVLYSLFIYNQIKPKKAALTKVIDDMAKVSGKRKKIILAYDRENEESVLAGAAKELMRTSTDRFQSFKKENDLMEKTTEGANALEDESLKNEILALNEQQTGLLKALTARANEYNAFIKKPPTNVVASLFGFRPF